MMRTIFRIRLFPHNMYEFHIEVWSLEFIRRITRKSYRMLHKLHILRGISSHQTIFYWKFLIVLKNKSNPRHSSFFESWANHSPEHDLPENGHIKTFFLKFYLNSQKNCLQL